MGPVSVPRQKPSRPVAMGMAMARVFMPASLISRQRFFRLPGAVGLDMKSLRIALVSLAVFAAIAILRPRKEPADRTPNPDGVQADVKACIESAMAGDVNRTLALMHPRLVAVGGGEGEFRKVMESYRQQLAGATLMEVRFPSVPKFVAGSKNEFVIVPVRQVLDLNGKHIETPSVYLGARLAAEAKWHYIDATLLNRQQVKALFPDLPDDVDLAAVLPR
jgi:hypothetical protein